MNDDYKTFHVGINVFVMHNNALLLGKRINIYGDGTWGLPGGHLEPFEKMTEAAARELLEETGLVATKLTFANITNDKGRNDHRLQIGFFAEEFNGTPEIKEPGRCEEWKWFPTNALPDNLFPPHKQHILFFLHNQTFGED